MIGVGLCLRTASASTGGWRGPVVRAVFRGSCQNKTLTRGHENIQVLDEIVEVRGREVTYMCHQKRSVCVKRDLYASKETYMCQKRQVRWRDV